MHSILLVEDDADYALLTREVLEDNFGDVEVVIAQSGEEALGKDLKSFDVILLDYNLPDMTGLEILRRISKREHGPIIMITGEEVLEIAVESLKEGADDFITKSVDLHQLLPHVVQRTISSFYWKRNMEAMEIREREKKIQIETLKRIMMTLAHHLNNAIMPIIFSAELCKRHKFSTDKTKDFVDTCLTEANRINEVIERFEKYIEDEEFKYVDYLDLKDAMFDVQQPTNQN